MKVYTYNDKVLVNSANDKWLKEKELPPIPDYTWRMKLAGGTSPATSGPPVTTTLVDASKNIWDVTSSNYFGIIGLYYGQNAIELLDWNPGDITGSIWAEMGSNSQLTKATITNFGNLTEFVTIFGGVATLEEVNLSNTDNLTNISNLFTGCTGLKSIPQFNVSSVTICQDTFRNCTNAESGIVDMYNALKDNTYQSSNSYKDCFTNCGSNTITGAAELAQIPSSWGGTGA